MKSFGMSWIARWMRGFAEPCTSGFSFEQATAMRSTAARVRACS